MADKNKKKNFFQRIAQQFLDVKAELKRVVWPSKEKLKNTSAVVLAVIVFFAIFLSIINNGGHWVLEKVGFYENVTTTTSATAAPADTIVSDVSVEETVAETEEETKAETEATAEESEDADTEESDESSDETEDTEETEESEEEN